MQITNPSKNPVTLFLVLFLCIGFSFTHIAQTHIQADIIMKEISKGNRVDYENLTIRGNLDFTLITNKSRGGSYGVRDGVVREYIGKVTAPVTFTNCTFLGEVITKTESRVPGVRKENFTWFEAPVTFAGCTFQERVEFLNMRIGDQLEITNSIFEDDIRFDKVHFDTAPVFAGNKLDGSFRNKRTNWIAEAGSLMEEEAQPENAVYLKLKNPSFQKIRIRFGNNTWTLSPLGTSGLNTVAGEEIYLVENGKKSKLLLKVSKDMDGETIDVAKLKA